MKHKYIILVSFLIFGVMAIFTSYSIGNSEMGDLFVYVAALEKERPEEPGTMWNPTLYKINVKDGRIVKSLKIADQGAPIACTQSEDKNIRIIVDEGIFANGTRPGEEIRKEFIINKDTMNFIDMKTKNKIPYERPIKSLPILKESKNLLNKGRISKNDIYLGSLSDNSRILLLANYRFRKSTDPLLKILDGNSFREIESIPLNVGDHKLNGFSWDVNTALLEDRYLVCLFYGDSSIGVYATGYVLIVDINIKIVRYTTIGSNPALGICY